MNRLTAPRTDTRVADEQQGLPFEPLKADQVLQQRFEQALAQQRARDNKALLDKPSKQDENRRAEPAVPFTSSKVADKEKELVDRGLARPTTRSKALNDKLEVNDDLQESQQLPSTSSQIPEGILASTAQQGRETTRVDQAKLLPLAEMSIEGFTKQPQDEKPLGSSTLSKSHKLPVAAEPDTHDRGNKYASGLPLAEMSIEGFTKQPQDEKPLGSSTLAKSHKLPVAAEPDTHDRGNKYASGLPLAEMSIEGFTKQPQDEKPLGSSTLAKSHKLPVAAEPDAHDRGNKYASGLPLAEMSIEGFTKQPQDEKPLGSSTLAKSHKLPVAAEPDAHDRGNKYASGLPLAEMSIEGFTKQPQDEKPLGSSTLAKSHKLPVAAEPDAHDRGNKYASGLPLAEMSIEGFTKQPQDEKPLGSSTLAKSHKQQEQSVLAARPEVGERQQTADEPTKQALVTSEEELLGQEIFAGSAIRVPPLAATQGDLLLARVAPRFDHHELGQLLSRLAVDIHLELGRPERPPMLQLTLPAIGELVISIEHHQGSLQVEMLASEQGSKLLNQGRGELIDRLQRLYPGEQVAFNLFTRSDSEQGSRQKRSIYDEWDADA
ncbi:type III secretion system needle length determinant [Aeromonas salmonicida]|uniref:type III secretion system needle length determinant n=1 Tax=Aeromonas salmonicida TaxID=645 RepID=UPI00232D643D|nr:type III secretion system needle length determinant [Aeromonas salmonicida]